MSAPFAALNRNKRAIAVDLQHPDGARLVFELARRADVVIENFVPGVAARLGLGYETVSAVNPSVVYASISGFGQDGPYARRPAYNLIAQAMSGIMALTGMPGHPPTRPGGQLADVGASYVAFGCVSAALVQRFRTGKGQYIDVNLFASMLGFLPDVVAIYFDAGVRPTREGNRNPNLTPAEVFRTRDGFLACVVMNPEQWDRFCRVLGDEAMRDDPRFAQPVERLANHADFKARVEKTLSTATTATWVERFVEAKLAAGPVYEFDEVFTDPQLKHLGLVTEVQQPELGSVKMLTFPARMSDAAVTRRPAPALGEHTAEVSTELGVDGAELERLATAGVIQLHAAPPSR